jgi:hypothetical protein
VWVEIDPGFGVARSATPTIPFLLATIPEKNGVLLESPEILLQRQFHYHSIFQFVLFLSLSLPLLCSHSLIIAIFRRVFSFG